MYDSILGFLKFFLFQSSSSTAVDSAGYLFFKPGINVNVKVIASFAPWDLCKSTKPHGWVQPKRGPKFFQFLISRADKTCIFKYGCCWYHFVLLLRRWRPILSSHCKATAWLRRQRKRLNIFSKRFLWILSFKRQAITSPSTHPCQWVSESVSDSFRFRR